MAGNMTLSEEMANELSAAFAKAHWVKYADGKHFCEAPVTTRGVPHNITPGIHKCCDDYLEALETLRKHAGREDAPTVDSFTCLSFSPWSQALAPVIEATADLSMRLCVRDPGLLSVQSGKAYLPDSTLEEEAIVREPLFRRPCQASISDNPFATSYEHVDSFFNLANSVVLMCRVGLMEAPSALNDTNLPTGRKLLKRALIGPTLTSWYPERIRKLDALFEDPDDRRRKVKLERMKRRGKGPPKKGEGKRAKKK